MENKITYLADILSKSNDIDINSLYSICKKIKINCHLVIMNQPYLDLIISGTKTIESRFTKVRCAPYREVKIGDILIFKESSGDILALSTVKKVEYFGNLTTEETLELMERFRIPLAITDEFIEQKKDSKYASLIHVDKTISIQPIKIKKSDRRAWVKFEYETYGTLF